MNCTATGGWKKSSFSFALSNCVEVAWHISTASANGSCVEAGPGECGMVHVRDSKLGSASPVLGFTPAEWEAFVAGVRAGEFDA